MCIQLMIWLLATVRVAYVVLLEKLFPTPAFLILL